MIKKILSILIVVAVYFGWHHFRNDSDPADVAQINSEDLSNKIGHAEKGAQISHAPSENVLGNSFYADFSAHSSVALQENKHSINSQLKLLAQAYKPNAEVIANVERFENIQFELLEEIGEIITMKEGDVPQDGDPDEYPAYAENKAHKSDEVYELALFTQFIGECFRSGFKDKPACTGTYGTNINRLSIRTPRAIDKLDQLALRGDLQAQSLYHASLLSAVDSFDMNTARDTELWLQRRQRMTGYSLKFARAGSALATKQLAELYDSSDYIEAQPFWAAVFYSQLSILANSGSFDLQRLISKNGLDEGEIEQARYDLFEDDN